MEKINLSLIILFDIFQAPRSHKMNAAGVDTGVLSKHLNIIFCEKNDVLERELSSLNGNRVLENGKQEFINIIWHFVI